MNHFQKLAKENPEAFKQARHNLHMESKKIPEGKMIPLSNEDVESMKITPSPLAAWRGRRFMAMIFSEIVRDGSTYLRMQITRTELNSDGTWKDGISWDELQGIKYACGFGKAWMTEVYPPDEDIVNPSNARHLWIVHMPPFGWSTQPVEVKKISVIERFTQRMNGNPDGLKGLN